MVYASSLCLVVPRWGMRVAEQARSLTRLSLVPPLSRSSAHFR
jgi:hypothetical protein